MTRSRWLCTLFALLLPLSALAAAPAAAPVAGVDYMLIEGGQPYQPRDGKIEVVEVFAYWCPHCAAFQPLLEAWKDKLPADVRLTYVPAVFSDGDAFARAYFAAEAAAALDKTHAATYRAIHDDKRLPKNATIDELAWFFGQQGLDAERMKAAMTSAATEAKLQRAREFAMRSGVEGTPTLIVDGRYRVLGKSREDSLRIASQLIAQLRPARR